MTEADLGAACAGGRPGCHLRDAGFAGLQNARVIGSWKLVPGLPGKAWEARECGACWRLCRQPLMGQGMMAGE